MRRKGRTGRITLTYGLLLLISMWACFSYLFLVHIVDRTYSIIRAWSFTGIFFAGWVREILAKSLTVELLLTLVLYLD